MARGRDAHHARLAAISRLGKTLTRRAGSVCELCADSLDLRPVEVAPEPEEPEADHAALLCARCRDLITAKKLPRDTDDLRFLETSVWSEVPAVQVLAVRLTRRLAAQDVQWATDALDGLWLDEDQQQWVDSE